MDINDYIVRYGVVARRRFYPKEKLRFLRGALREFIDMGIEDVDVKEAKIAQRKAFNMYAGNLMRSKMIVNSYYDTPAKTLGLNKYKVYNYKNDNRANKISILLPEIIIILLGMLAIYFVISPVWGDGVFNFKDILVTILFIFIIYIGYRYRNGLGNTNNFIRNTSGIITSFMFAKKLNKSERKDISFAFTDFGCINHFGDNILLNEIEVLEKEPLVVILDSVGDFNNLSILYNEDTKAFIDKIKPFAKKNNIKLIKTKEEHYTIFANSIIITSGREEDGDLIIDKANGLKDNEMNNENILNTIKLLEEIYKVI